MEKRQKLNRIKEVLIQKGVSQAELARRLNKSYNMVNGYVSNREQPRLVVLFHVAEILEVNPCELLNVD